jgi:hypothetical protein
MSLLRMAQLTPEEREARRERDEACFRRVHAEIERGYQRGKAFDRVAAKLRIKRDQVIAGYWRHVRREGFTQQAGR